MPLLRMNILLRSFFYFVTLCVIALSDMLNSEKKKGSICQYHSLRAEAVGSSALHQA